jgi:hypothetical protein
MDAEQNAKIEAGVVRCLDDCRAERPYSRLAEFIAGLRADPNWTSEEIVELQTQVIRALLFRAGRQDEPAAVTAPATPQPQRLWLGLTMMGALLLTVTVVILAIFLIANLTLNSQFRVLRQQRQDAMKNLNPPTFPRPAPPPAEQPPNPQGSVEK